MLLSWPPSHTRARRVTKEYVCFARAGRAAKEKGIKRSAVRDKRGKNSESERPTRQAARGAARAVQKPRRDFAASKPAASTWIFAHLGSKALGLRCIIWTLEASELASLPRTSPMEDSKKREARPRLLDLIPNEKEWKVRGAQGPGRSRTTGFGGDEDKKLELKLGLPGLMEEEIAAVSRNEGIQQESPTLSLGYFAKPSKYTANTTTTGTKRGFSDTVEAKTEGCNEQKQQARAGCGNELALEEKIAAANERKKGCCPPPPSRAPPAATVRNRPKAQGRVSSAPVVGWPPIRSFRRNLANSSSSKQPTEPQNGEANADEKLACKKISLVKINMDGIPIGRKVDLAAYGSYERLSLAVRELFHGFLEAQKDTSTAESAQLGADEKIFSQLLHGSGEYTLVYEDNEGDRMLVGDVPWDVFVSTAKRLRVLRTSELSHGLIRVAPKRVPNC